jgi:nucleoside-diphosphate-sugar epimerase
MRAQTLGLLQLDQDYGGGTTEMKTTVRQVFIAGATGYVGSRVAAELARRGHRVSGLTRAGSERKLPGNCEVVVSDALNAATFGEKIGDTDTYVQFVGVAHPAPRNRVSFARSI